MINKIDELDGQYETLIFTQVYASRGDLDLAFMWFEQASEKSYPRYYVEFDPYLTAMRNNPRWKPILNRFVSTNRTSQ